ncbi:hypothetical protein JCM10908_007194 [Rhodotorula pacifica]|uniref:fungal specific transcription factor domain-containing protein n=1 Tax=Rhodotorula pacifica TaxID=1495444 RepID=UPI00317980CF
MLIAPYTAQLEERIRELEGSLQQSPPHQPPLRRTSFAFEDESQPVAGPSRLSPSANAPSFAGTPPPYHSGYSASANYGSALSLSAITSTLPAPAPPPPPPAPVQTAFLPPAFVPSVSFASSSEALEKQPRNAFGYEWNERANSSKPSQDGTASLSLEPDGQGYLGFASGATLLRILQIIAGVSHIDVPAGPSSDTTGWQPTDAETTACIDAYFTYYHVEYPLIHEATFRAQWNEVIPPPAGPGWQILTNVVLALGAFVSFRPMEAVDFFLERALAKVNVDCLEVGNLTLVQAFTLLSNITQKRNKPNAGSIYLGIATRMATSLGLHRELPSWQITPHEREVRRRLWWTVFCFDAGACITFGRPILLPAGEADVQMVHNVSDRAFPPSATSVPPPSPEPTMYTSLIHQASFHRLGNQWKAGLPSWMHPTPEAGQAYPRFSFSAHKLFWRYSNLRIILHRRAFLERALKGAPLAPLPGLTEAAATDLDAACASLCLQSAADTISAIHQFLSSHRGGPNRLEWWYGLHFLFHASFVPLIALHADPTSSSRSSWLSLVALTCTTLSILSTEPLAQRCLQIIEMLKPREDPNGSLQLDTGILAEMLARSEWAGQDAAQNWLPFADLATLSSFWPAPST